MCLVTYTFAVSNAEQVENRKFMTMDLGALPIGRSYKNCSEIGQPCGVLDPCCDHLYYSSYIQGNCKCIGEGEKCGLLHICCEGLSCTSAVNGKCSKIMGLAVIRYDIIVNHGLVCYHKKSDMSLSIWACRIQNHLDELLWDGLKSNLRAIGLIFRTSNKVVEQKNLVNELEDKDRERGENGATKGHPISERGDGHDESHGRQPTLKERYDLLKEYKQGLFVDTDVDEEIKLYEDSLTEARGPSSAPADVAVPTLNDQGPTSVEPL
ncbi:hypothetical protein TIFTF001_033310 [Ficus carica]|uniref:Uncharacterized protein n=1 Tax=Ficus carica TaxID=3494 RepID=A0AA88J6Y7_FICCA|nr:hypothetical protein TIFTF001_033310 [Ficus carica]